MKPPTQRERARQLASTLALYGHLRGEQCQFLESMLVLFAQAEIEIARHEASTTPDAPDAQEKRQ